MKNLILFLCFLACFSSANAQETYTINNETLQLKTEVEGDIDLLWIKTDKQYRFFVKSSNGEIQELHNTKGANNSFQEEYKTILKSLITDSNMSLDSVSFGRYSLKQFIKAYNSKGTKSYAYTDEKVKTQSRISFFTGLTNHPFIENQDNVKPFYFGAEIEVYDEGNMPRQTGFFNIRHAIKHNNFKYSATQLSIGYRYRFVNRNAFNIYVNLKAATFTAFKSEFIYEEVQNPSNIISDKSTGSTFQVPFIFGIGSDIKISENSFITLTYHEIFAVFIESSSNYPMDFAIGYKFNM